jgi:sugar O-acyltransferase (sialic acid O-acetyltransferase NeuD family)
MKRVAIIGSGELSIHIAHYLEEDNQFKVVGFFDDFTPLGSKINSHTIIGKLKDIKDEYNKNTFDGLINGIGYSRMEYREEVFNRFINEIPFPNFIHSSCIIDNTSQIGKGVIIFPMSMLYFNSVIEDNVFIQVNSTITDSKVCKNSMISAGVMVAGRSIIGNNCNIGVSTCISSDVKICNNVTTGAGTVVVKNILESGTYVGVPAKKIK